MRGPEEVKRIGRALAEKLVHAIENGDAEALMGLFDDDAVLHHPLSPEPIQGKAEIEASEQVLFDAFSDIDVEVLRVMAEADDVVIEVVLRATNSGPLDLGADERLPPTGRRIELPAAWFLTLGSGGRIVEERDYLDTAHFFRQLGLASDA
jgi:steroid delta-isomerase-like uncharacterized protein